MQTIGISATPSLNEWASFLGELNAKKTGGQVLLKKDVNVMRMIAHLEGKLAAARKYSVGKQLKLFTS